jgi:monofunctional glycosyltransferase
MEEGLRIDTPQGPMDGQNRLFSRRLLGLGGAFVLMLAVVAVIQVASWPDVAGLALERPKRTAFMRRYVEQQRRSGRDTTIAFTWVPFNQVSPYLKAAIVVGEDIEFFDHNGFSVSEIKAALEDALRERAAPRGASTLTQQLAKNLWLSPSRNPFRKVKEAILVKQLEARLSKERIFELYINVAEFGPGIYGAEAAARHYFGKPASRLTQTEGAQLAAGLPRPASWNPESTSSAYERRVGRIEDLIAFHRAFLERRVGLPPVAPILDSSLLDVLRAIPVVPDTIQLDTTRTSSNPISRQFSRRDGDRTGHRTEAVPRYV